jgi:hypothetical protein
MEGERRVRVIALIGIALGLLASASAAQAQERPAAGLEFVDLTDDFDRVWTETSTLPDDKRVEAFEAAFAKILPGFYSADRVKDFMPPEKYRGFVLKGLKSFPEHRDGIQRVSREFRALVAPAQKQFESVFGTMRGYPPIYLVVSFGEFDGGTRSLPEGTRLMFGADVIDRIYKDKPIAPFIEHELFHLMHHRTFPDCDPVWCSLWEEGLATYVASAMNPTADDAALLLTFPVPLKPAVEANKQEAICAVKARLNSTMPADYRPLFMGGGDPLSKNLPLRFGYYVGFLVAGDLGRDRTLQQLAALQPEEVRPLIEQSLDRMASCPAGERG